MIIEYRVPCRCQNGHFRWEFYSINRTGIRRSWGPRNCDCPTGDIDQGYSPCGDPQLSTGKKDRTGRLIYEGDYLCNTKRGFLRKPKPLYFSRKLVAWRNATTGTGFNVGNGKGFEVIGNNWENQEYNNGR